ncbi:MAG: tRNA uridine-5-carboxymethylaminomethyl(34) synthesis GTPase MnmE [Pseudomonadota bacterium]
MDDTIYAFASGAGKAGVSVLRVSGPFALQVSAALGVQNLSPRQASLRNLRGPDGEVLDQALVLYFASGASFTGEDVVEFHVHGSIAVQRALYAAIQRTGLARQAEAGEFTRRALMNDRLDLTEVQGLADIIEAETEVQRREALRVLSGEMSAKFQAWREGLTHAQALLEASIDFADEEVPEDVLPEVQALLRDVRGEMSREVRGYSAARSLRDGFRVALVGAPNVGKSALVNYLVQRESSLVSDIPGTTRDILENRIDIKGLEVILLDMAGIRETGDAVEALGVERALSNAEAADVRVFLYEGDVPSTWPVAYRKGDIVRKTKVDLSGGDGVSTMSGAGIAALTDEIYEELSRRVSVAGFVSRQRDKDALVAAIAEIDRVLKADDTQFELAAETLRQAAWLVRTVIGEVGVEDILDDVFASFCLGK